MKRYDIVYGHITQKPLKDGVYNGDEVELQDDWIPIGTRIITEHIKPYREYPVVVCLCLQKEKSL